MKQPVERNVSSVIIGSILVIVGVMWLIGQFVVGSFWAVSWPLFVILPGLIFFAGMLWGGKQAAGLAIPGTIITVTGLVLFYQNLTGQWWTWSFIWALTGPMAVGLGLIIFGLYSDNPGARRAGTIVLIIGTVLLAVFGFAFGFERYNIAGYAWPLILIGLGIYIVIKRTRAASSRVVGDDDDRKPVA